MESSAVKPLRLIELFASVQGETLSQGLPTTFIRLAGCNLRCTWCDTPYSFGRGEEHTQEEVIRFVEEAGCQEVCVTGGEPLMQKAVYPLMKALCDLGYSLQIETGGSLPTSEVDPRVRVICDIKCPGSLMSHKNHYENLLNLRPHDEVKFVIADAKDYAFTKEIITKYQLDRHTRPSLLSPVFDKLESKTLVEWMLEDKLKNVRLNLQMHKFIWQHETI